MIKGTVFDVDGTLLDSMNIWDELGNRYLKSIGKVPEDNLSSILFPMTLQESSQYLKETYHIDDYPRQIEKDIVAIMEDFYRYEVQLKSGALTCLEVLYQKRIPMVVATIGDIGLIEAAFKRLNINRYFDTILTCDMFHTTKHEPLIYQKAAEYLHIQCSEMLVFEDVYYALQSAKKAGCITVGIEDTSSQKDKKHIQQFCDYYEQDFNNFLKENLL